MPSFTAAFSARDLKMAQTSSNEVFKARNEDYDQWKTQVTDYLDKKKEFQGEAPKYIKVTNKVIKELETRYNPITQVFTDQTKEQEAQKTEQDKFIHTLASNKDKALRYEQTYDVINFSNKLVGLEHRADYPKEKPWYFRPNRDSLVDYNIVSNYSLAEHFYDAPDKRPACKDFVVKIKPKMNKNFRDYNIISNKYLEHHDAKAGNIDDKILKAEAAQKYWKTHDFDPITCQYYDPEKEQKWWEKKKEADKDHGKDQVKKLPITVQNEGMMYNPINMKIEDQKRLFERDLREKNKKARFELRYDVEDLVRRESLAEQDRLDRMVLNKISGNRFREEIERGFNILSNDQLKGKDVQYKNSMLFDSKKPYEAWNETIKQTRSNRSVAQEQEAPSMMKSAYSMKSKSGIRTGGFQRIASAIIEK